MSRVYGRLLDSLVYIEGDTLNPDRLRESIGLTTVAVERPGRVETDLDGTELDALPGQWIARTAGRLQSSSVDEHLHFLLGILRPHRAMLRELAAGPRGRVWIGLEVVTEEESGLGLSLDAALSAAVRELGADVWVFAPGDIPGAELPPSA